MCFPEISFGACILLALLLLTVPLPWVGAALLAAAVHEGAHVLALSLMGEGIRGFSLTPKGAELRTSPLPHKKELLAAAAGPAASLLLGLLIRSFPRLSICGLTQGLFNLLPIYPMDGGRILRCLLRFCFSEEKTEKLSELIQWGTLAGLGFLAFSRESVWGLILVLSLIFRILGRKIPCKDLPFRVQ